MDFFIGISNWVSHVTRSSVRTITITIVDIEPMSFKGLPFLVNLFIDISNIGISVIGSESVGWFRDIFMFNIVNRKSSITHIIGLGPISVFGNSG
jgi:polygalacturonase